MELITIIAVALSFILSFYYSFCIVFDDGFRLRATLCFLLSVFTLSCFAGFIFSKSERIDTRESIYSAKDNMATKGSFSLGSGTIGSELKYFFYTKKENGALVQSSVPGSSEVYEDSTPESAHVHCWTTRYTNFIGYEWVGGNKQCALHVPKDTVITGSKFDLE